MRLIVHKLRYKNFLSTGNLWTELELDKHATTLIVGPNGAGKSTVLDAISFVLFNRPFRDMNKPKLVNTITRRDCVVEIEFTINTHFFKVIRGINPTIFEIWKDGELLTQAADNRDYQKVFEQYILRVNHKTFCQVVMLSSDIFKPFLTLPAQGKRDVIEDLLDLKIFSKMNVILKKKLSDLEKNIDTLDHEKTLLEQRVDLITKHLEETNENIDADIEANRYRISKFEEQLPELNNEFTKINEEISDLRKQLVDDNKTKLRYVAEIRSQLELKLSQVSAEIDFLNAHEICPTCSQNIDESFKLHSVVTKNEKRTELSEALAKVKKRLVKHENIEECNNNIQHRIVSLEKLRLLNSNNVASINATIRSINNDISELELKKQRKEVTDNIEELNKQLIELDGRLIGLTEEKAIMTVAANLLKDTGIKAQFLKIYIPIINYLIQNHLKSLECWVDFKIDESFDEIIKSRGCDEFSFHQFSQGEKSKLNIALLFAWRDIARMRGSFDTNLIIFDELLDSSIDEDNLEDVIKSIKALTNDENVIIISHKRQMHDKFDRLIEFSKTNTNFSRIV